MKKNLYYYLIAVVSTLIALTIQWRSPALLNEFIEGKSFDLRLKLREQFHNHQPRPDILIVTIDEKSLKEVGRWAWSRSVMADLVNKISAGKPKAIGIDVLFSEVEGKQPDNQFAASLQKAGNVVLATAFLASRSNNKDVTIEEPPDFLWESAFMQVRGLAGLDWKQWAITGNKVIPPIKVLATAATLGHVSTLPDLDGTLRWEILTVRYGDDFYPSLPLQIARMAAGIPLDKLTLYGGSGIGFGERTIPTDLSGRVIVNYVGQEGSYTFISATDVLHGRIPASRFKDAIVLVGATALGTFDQKISPLSGNMPGVEKNATVVQNILDNDFIRKSPGIIEVSTILLTSLLLAVLLPRLSAGQGVTIGFSLIAAYSVLTCWFLIYRDVWVSSVLPIGNMFIIMTVETISKLFTEEKQAREIKRMFSNYVSPKIVQELINHPELAKLGGHRCVVTILFSDIIGFTTLSEKLPPEEVVTLLNEYYHEMAEVIFRWDGTLDKFVGDEIMAVWSAPLEQVDHAERAVRCAIDMSQRLEELQKSWVARGRDAIDCGIGINTGEVLVGNIGLEGKKMDYTVIGNHVNIAARVEKLTRQYHNRILITDTTMAELKLETFDRITFDQQGEVLVKGKDQPVSVIAVKHK